jgi:hypothetical protein
LPAYGGEGGAGGPNARTAIRASDEAHYEHHIVPAPYDDIDWQATQPVADDLSVIKGARLDEARAMFLSRAEPFAGGWLEGVADTGCGPCVNRKAATRWFRALRRDLREWSGAGTPKQFVVGFASSDSHAIPLSAMPGERDITWVKGDSDAPLADQYTLHSALRSGHCVASCGGDFAVLRINGRGPGEVCPNDGSTQLVCEFEIAPRHGHHIKRVRLLNRYGGVLRQWDAIDGASFTHHLDPPKEKSFYVGRFDFADSAGKVWEVWTNPV